MLQERPTRLHESPWARLTEAAIAYAEADDEDDTAYERARKRLHEAVIAYVRRK